MPDPKPMLQDSEASSHQTTDTGETSPESDAYLPPRAPSSARIIATGATGLSPDLPGKPAPLSAKARFLINLSNYVPLGSLICQQTDGTTGEEYTHEFREIDHLPSSIARISAQRQIRSLTKKHWVRIFVRKLQDEGKSLHVRVYVLPDDVGRKYVERAHSFLRPCLVDLVRFLDKTPQSWDGYKCKTGTLYELGSQNDDSLFYIFNRLPSPSVKASNVACPYASGAIQEVLESDDLFGLKTRLYPYQKRTVATMIRREAEPARTLDPRLQPLTGPTGVVFYMDTEAGILLRDKREYDEACGGILGESMGLGKTLICLATILATKGHWPSIPPEYSLDLHKIRPHVASLMQTAAAAVAEARIPWRSLFQEMSAAGEELANCQALLKENIPSYVIPVATSNRNTRRPSGALKGRTIKLCAATLVVVPQNLLSQWNHEIARHVEEGSLNVLRLETSNAALVPSAEKLQQYDIILMSRQRLEREFIPPENTKATFKGGCSCSLDEDCFCTIKNDYQSPLKDLHFLRVIMDEGHEFSSYGNRNNTYWALQQLHVDRKWIVSGTPTSGLIGVEVGVAASETADLAGSQPSETNAEILQRRRKESALLQERKDLEKLGGLVVGFLKLRPWANSKSEDPATWPRYIMPSQHGKRKPTSLQSLLQSLVVRHRIEDIQADLQLPPLYNRVVYLDPSWYDKLSINLFVMALVVNAATSERVDEDYMFHPKNRRFLHAVVTNLRQANFYWTSWAPEAITKTMQASRAYLEDHSLPGSVCSDTDRRLLERAIQLGDIILECNPWKAFSQVHEMGIFVEGFPEGAQDAWSLTERAGSEPLLSGATQMIKAQEWVDAHLYLSEATHALSDMGTKTMRKLWAQGEEAHPPVDRPLAQNETNLHRRKDRSAGLVGIPRLTQKQTVSRVKAVPSATKPKDAPQTQQPSSQVGTTTDPKLAPKSALSSSATPLAIPTLAPGSPLANTRIIGTASTKLSYLLDQLSRYHSTEKILVFYEGDHIAYYIAQALELLSIRHLIYTGTLSPARQSAYVTTFNTTSTFRVLLMDVHQAAHGLHIASASRVYFVNPVWQPNVEAQAIKRAHRIGQTKPVYVETLVLRDTLEDQMLQRRKGMTAQEHQKAEKSLLDDDTMSTIIKNASFIPLQEKEIKDVGHQIARLQMPQQLFGRPDRPTGDVSDPDADIIFPDGTPKKSRKSESRVKRKSGSQHAPDLTGSPRPAQRTAAVSAESPTPQGRMTTSVPDRTYGSPNRDGESSTRMAVSDDGAPRRTVAFALDESGYAGPSGLSGGPSIPSWSFGAL